MKHFKILHKDGEARVGRLETAHGVIETPQFNPVGTQATVKALSPKDLKEIGVQIILANTYHLMLRPGADLIEKLGGLHQFMNWSRPIMTDSGGFQVYSLGVALEHGSSKVLGRTDTPGVDLNLHTGSGNSKPSQTWLKPRLNKITEEGVIFQSHLDGSRHILTPEKSIEIQRKLGADLMVAFDDHESSKHTKAEMEKSLGLTQKWGVRSLREYQRLCHSGPLRLVVDEASKRMKRARPESRFWSRTSTTLSAPQNDRKSWDDKPLLYGVVHGGTHKDLRIRSARFTDKHFDAIAIGGIYGDKKTLCQVIQWILTEVSENKPRHLLGIGEVEDLFNGVERGIDFFDCVAPTRRARFGSLYISPQNGGRSTNAFTINLRQSRFASDPKPLDPACRCSTCQNFSRAYLRHLYFSEEILYHQLATYHNVYFITRLVLNMREDIKNGQFGRLKDQWLKPR